ncbi:MAG: phenylalanine--tRNA ligase subunit beta [Anaerolineae bacterium]|nr:phenylalanine--tRNA ligase subunit beta [Anaerolineae bacterium]
MRVPISWLKDYVDITLPIPELAERLTLAGLEVGKIEYYGVPSGDSSDGHLVWDREKIKIGAIVEVKPHPDADRLTIAMVDYGGDALEPCVNGAPNLYPYKGQGRLDPPLKAVIAFEGAELYDGHKDDGSRMVLKARKLRGIENRSMVCSEKELGLSDSHEGIIILDPNAPVGAPAQDVLGDIVLDIELTPNLARCWGIVPIAREVAALTGQRVRYPSDACVMEGPPIEGQAYLKIEEPALNPRFTLTLIKDVEIKPSPYWMQRRLVLAGMRAINNMVDATNYVMLETGQPIHAFDYDILVERAKRVGDVVPTIITRTARPGETIETLDEVHRELDDFTVMVCDTAGVLSIGGIIGGAESEVYDASTYTLDAHGVEYDAERGKADARPRGTTNILLEVASWNFINLRKTLAAQRDRGKEVNSEAGQRLSRGVHPELALLANKRAIEMMRRLGGGTIAQGCIDHYPAPPPVAEVDLPLEFVNRLSGITLASGEVVNLLTALEFECDLRNGGTVIHVVTPPHRLDIDPHDPATARADLVEEVLRIYGYDKIPNTLIVDELPPQRSNVALEREERVRDVLVQAGLREVVSYRLTTPEREALLTPPGAASSWPDAPYVVLANPTSSDKVAMRQTLLSGLMDIAAANLRSVDRAAIFEVGQVFLKTGEPLPDEPPRLGILLVGPRDLPAWMDQNAPESMDFYDLKGVVETMAQALHLPDVTYTPAAHGTFRPGRTASLNVAGASVGVFGEVHPLVSRAYGVPEDATVLAAEFDLAAIQNHMADDRFRVEPISRYAALYQDIAVVVDAGAPAADVQAEIVQAGAPLLREARLFDVYQGEQIEPGKKSLAYALTFRSDTQTLTDKAVAKMQQKVIKALEKKFDAKLRV